MTQNTTKPSFCMRSVAVSLLYLLAAFLFSTIHFKYGSGNSRGILLALTRGEWFTPYQFHALVPAVVRVLLLVLPLDVRTAYYLVEFAATGGLLLAYRALLAQFFERRFATLFSLLLLYPLFWHYCVLGRNWCYLVSDVPALLLFVLAVLSLQKGRVLSFLAIGFLACLNRPSGIVLALTPFAIRGAAPRSRDAAVRATGVLVLWTVVQFWLAHRFQGSVTHSSYQLQWRENLQGLMAVLALEASPSRYLLMFGGTWALIPFVWRQLPDTLRGLVLLVIPHLLVVAALGSLHDPRAYGEPIVSVTTVAFVWFHSGLHAFGAPVAVERIPVGLRGWLGRALRSGRAVLTGERPCPWILVCLLLSYLCVRVHQNLGYHPHEAALAGMTARRPFQYRVLVPFVAGQIHRCTGWSLSLIYTALNTAFVCGLLAAYRVVLARFIGDCSARYMCFLILVPILYNYCALNEIYYPSDLPGVSFFVVGALCLAARQWPAYYSVFVLASLNRETSCFLTFLLVFIHAGRLSWRVLGAHCIAQLAIWLTVKAALTLVFLDNPGPVMVEIKLGSNWDLLVSFLKFSPEAWRCLLVFGLTYATIPLIWHELPLSCRRALFVGLPFLLGMSIVGNLGEVRIYGELIPIVTVPAAIWIHTRLWPSAHQRDERVPGGRDSGASAALRHVIAPPAVHLASPRRQPSRGSPGAVR